MDFQFSDEEAEIFGTASKPTPAPPKKSGIVIVDVAEGETEEAALARSQGKTPTAQDVRVAKLVHDSHERLGIAPHAETEAILAAAGPAPTEDGPSAREWKVGAKYSTPYGVGTLLVVSTSTIAVELADGKHASVPFDDVGEEQLPDGTPELAPPVEQKAKRKRRTKAEMEADNSSQATEETARPKQTPPSGGWLEQPYTDDHAPENIAQHLSDCGVTSPVPVTVRHEIVIKLDPAFATFLAALTP